MWCCWNIADPGQRGGLGALQGRASVGRGGCFVYLLSVRYWLGATFPPSPRRCCNLTGISWELLSAEGNSAGDGVAKSPWQPDSELLWQEERRRREGAGLHSAMWSRGHLPSSKPVREKMLITLAQDRGVILGELDLARRMLRVGGREGNIQTQ